MKEKHTPKYLQLKREILSWLHSGRLKLNDQIPSENEIAEQFQMSRQTVRQTFGIQLGHRRIAGFFKTDDLQGVNRLKKSNRGSSIGIRLLQ